MVVVRHFGRQQRYVLLPTGFAQIAQAQARALALLQRRGALEIGEGKVGLPVAAIRGAEEREQGRVLADGQELSITGGPANGSKVPGKNPDFSYELIRHS